ncbi:MAG: ORF6N domain-containing protein [Bacteroidota bacterium]
MKAVIIQQKIFDIRGQKVMLDKDLAELYKAETRSLKQAVKRNRSRFPKDFMFQLTNKEINTMVSQNVIPSKGIFGGALPFAFTEQGVAMLSSVLNSRKAVQVNIAVMRAFVEIRKFALLHKDVIIQLRELKARIGGHDTQLTAIYDAIEDMLDKSIAQ